MFRTTELTATSSQHLAQRLRLFRALVSAGLGIQSQQFNAAVSLGPASYRIHLERTWTFASTVGVPPRVILDAVIRALDDDVDRARRISLSVAGPAMATRIVLALPVVALVMLGSLGFNAFGVLMTTPLGWACLCVASMFTIAGFWWSRRLIANARQAATLPGFGLALISVGLSAGISLERIIDVMTLVGLNHQPGVLKDQRQAQALMRASSGAGIPMAQLLSSFAVTERDRENVEVGIRLEKLSEKILLPLGACILPAFIVLVAVPAVASSLLTTVPAVG